METKTNKVATINNVEIITTEDELIPIKPICEALGIDYPTQFTKLKEHDFLNSVIGLSPTTGSDGKEYGMVCLPKEFIYGWLFTINPKNVKPEAQEAVAKYQIECYRVLYKHFAEPEIFLKEQRQTINKYLDEQAQAKLNFRDAKNILDAVEKELNITRKQTIEEWREKNRRPKLDFDQETE